MNRIHDSITESSFELPSNPTNSASMESGHVLESVAEGDVEPQDCSLPTEDDIEKSFRVNQDGSMTVEMKVRLTIKEEETVHWTTTLSRSSVANQTNGKSLPTLEAEQICSEVSESMDLQSSAAAKDAIKTDVSEESEEEALPQWNGELGDSIKEHVHMSPQRTPTPGTNCVRQKHASVESITSVSAVGMEEGTITSFSYKEQTEHESMTEQYCMFKQKSTRPVPKPRRFGSVDGNGRNMSMFQSAGMSEFLQIESSGDEVTETVLHVYEQQSCQDNFLSNLSGVPLCRPSSGNRNPQPEVRRPSTASESISMWRAESMSLRSDLVLPTVKTSKIQATELTERAGDAQRREPGKDKRIASKSKVTNKLGRIMSPGKRQKQVKPLPGSGVLRKNYGNKLRSAKSAKLSKQQIPQMDERAPALKENRCETVSLEENKNDAPNNSGQTTHQPLEHRDGETTSLLTFDSSGSATNKYVEKWLEQSHQQTYDEEERKRVHVAKVVKQLEMTSETQTGQALKQDVFPDNVRRASVKQRILSFENKSSNPSLEKKSTQQQIIETDTKLCNVSAQNNLVEVHPGSNHCRYEKNPQIQEMSTESENRLCPIETSLHNATASLSLSMDLPSPPTAAEMAELLSEEEGMIPPETSDATSRVSSGGREMSDQPLSSSPTPDKLIASVDQMSERTTSVQPDSSATPLSRTPSTKKVPLVSNLSFDRKMSLRKARMDKYTASCDDTPVGETGLPNIRQTGAAHLTSEAPMQESSTSPCSSAYPTSLESDGRMSTGSLSSNEASIQSVQTSQTSEKEAPLTPTVTNVKPGRSPSPERKPKSEKISPQLTHNSPAMSKHKSPKMIRVGEEKHITPNASGSTKRKQVLPQPELASSNHSDDSDVTEMERRSSKGKSEQAPQTVRSTAPQSVSDKTENQVKPQQHNVENQPNMNPVLEELCNSIKSLRQMLQSRRQSCLEQSSLPGFSSHVASMFGSSSKVLLAFLSVMTLKDGITDRYRDELNANAVSCAEALKTIDSLREIAAIEDSHQLNGSLLDLQRSASRQLMESWKSFQEFCTKCKSSSSTSVSGEKAPERGSDDIIDEIMDKLDIPNELKVELTSLSEEVASNSDETEMIRDANGLDKGHVMRSEDTHRPSIQRGSSEAESNELQMHKEDSETVPETEGSGSEAENQGGGTPLEEEPEVESDGTKYESAGAGDDSSDHEGASVEEEQPALNYYAELSTRTSSSDSEPTRMSKDETTGQSNSEQARLNRTGHEEVEASVDDSDMEEPASEEELAEDQSVESKAIVRNVFEEQESTEDLEQEDINQHLHTKKDKSSLIINHENSSDEDSGNDHSNCDTNAETEAPKVSSSTEEELSYYEKELSSEEEQLTVNGYSSRDCRKTSPGTQSEGKTRQNVANHIPAKEVISQSIAERVSLLEKQVADAQRPRSTTARPTVKCSSQRSSLLQSDGEDSESPSSESALASRSAPQSSLSFSYDSSGVITTEPERTRVKSIREMFLAKSATDTKQGNGTTRSPLPDLRAETSVSGGYQTQTSSDVSGAEDDSVHKSISKGLVRRTIERLYGKKDVNPEPEAAERPPSAPKQKKKDHSRIFSTFHNVRSKTGSEVSYFNSTNVLDTLSEATKYAGFNAQVRPGENVPSENGQWLIRKSVSDPVGINQGLTTSTQAEGTFQDTSEKTPHSLCEREDKGSPQRKCTYFSLPHGSESDVCQDEPSTVTTTANADGVADTTDQSKDSKSWAERNGVLPAVGITDFKKMDNKVHPLVEPPPDGEVVLAQPARGHGVVIRRAPDPDVLDLLYNFCGQNCPIL